MSLPGAARMAVGTKPSDKIRHIVVNMVEACNDWNCRLNRLGLLPPPSSAFISSVLGVSVTPVRSISAQARPAIEHGLVRQVLPSCKSLWKPLIRRVVWEDYAARFDTVIIQKTVNDLHRASTPVVLEELRDGLNKRFRDCEYRLKNGIGKAGLRKLLLGLAYRYRLRYAETCSVIRIQQKKQWKTKLII